MCIVEYTLVKRPFVCPDCDKKFSTKSSWDRHGKIHTGEKPPTDEVSSVGKDGHGDIDMGENKIFGSSVSCTGNEESSI